MGAKDPLNLDQLADTYVILGELAGRDDARTYLGTRRADEKPVLITISREPAGDEGNALSHLAADANLLAGTRHRNLVPILEGRWLGADALAVITERGTAQSLEDQLSRRDEAFSFPRIATILQEVNGALEWARAQKVVHRGVQLDSVFVDPGSDRVQVVFAVRPLLPSGIPGELTDAKTIAALARAMLTRSVADPDRDKLSLAELRPGLPTRVVEQTELLLGPSAPVEAPDVRGYIAAIAMAEELKRGETEFARVTGEVSEEQRVTRETLAAERKAQEDDLAAQAARFAKEKEDSVRALSKDKEDSTRALAKEKEELLRTVAKEREEMARAFAKDKEELTRATTTEREDLTRAVAKERKELQRAIEKERSALAQERNALAKERAAFERSSAKLRDQIGVKLAALQAQADLHPRTSEAQAYTPEAHERFVTDFKAEGYDEIVAEPKREPPPMVDRPAVEEPGAQHKSVAAEPPVARPALVGPMAGRPFRAQAPARSRDEKEGWWARAAANRTWRRGAVGAVVLLLIAVSALAVGRSRGRAAAPPPPAPQVRTVDSLAGGVAAPLVAVDSSPTLLLAADTTSAPAPRRERPVRRLVAPLPADSIERTTNIRVDSSTASRRDSSAARASVRRDTTLFPRRDSVPPRVDSLARPDSTSSGPGGRSR